MQLAAGSRVSVAGISPLVGGTKAQCILGAGADPLVDRAKIRLSGCEAQWFLELVSSHLLCRAGGPRCPGLLLGSLIYVAVFQDLCLKVSGVL